MELHTKTINNFFNKFPFIQKKQTHAIDYIFFENIIPKAISARVEQAIEPSNLNIFEGFNLGENELKHCSVLSWFLNPSANHSQGELFLNTFLKKYNIKDINKYTKGGYFQVKTEDNFASNGRVDITISSNDFWFIIEAKILAPEQDKQISRYRNILDQKSQLFGIPQERCKLFYLTVDGKESSSGEEDFRITWQEISGILMSFATKCQNKYISSTAIQYSKYINNYI